MICGRLKISPIDTGVGRMSPIWVFRRSCRRLNMSTVKKSHDPSALMSEKSTPMQKFEVRRNVSGRASSKWPRPSLIQNRSGLSKSLQT